MGKPQPWPRLAVEYASIILSKNDVFILSLVICHKRLKEENLDTIRALLPDLVDGARTIYEAALSLGVFVESRKSRKMPLWATLTEEISREYPLILSKLRHIESKIQSQRLIEIRREVAEIINTAAAIQVKLIDIEIVKEARQVLLLQAFKLDQIKNDQK